MTFRLRPTVAADLALVSAKPLPYRVQFTTLMHDDDVIAVGGMVFRPDGTVWIAAHITDAGRRAAVTLHRAGLLTMARARAMRIPRMLALADPSQPRSEAWLRRCGFAQTDHFEQDRRVWQWTAGVSV